MKLSIIIPVLNESAGIGAAVEELAPLRRRGAEIVVVDGGSQDSTATDARPYADMIINAPRGRSSQMNAGAGIASGDVLLFLHADTRLPPEADGLIAAGLERSARLWGRFDVRISGGGVLPVVAMMMNVRSRLTGIATGDQAIFVTRKAFTAAGGYPDIALMEDIALTTRLKKMGRPLCLRPHAVTSGRRWQQRGVVRTILLMWRLRLAYFLGADPSDLAERYGYARSRR